MSGSQASIRGRLLIVDDEPAILRAYSHVLVKHGHDVVTAQNAKVALEQFRQAPFDAIFTDISMPGMDGVELVRAVRQQDRGVPVVFFTGASSLSSAEAAVALRAFRYVDKPVPLEELIALADEAVAECRSAREVERVVRESCAATTRAAAEIQVEKEKAREQTIVLLRSMIAAMSVTMERRDPYTAGHARRVADLSVAIAGECGWDAGRIEGLRMAALVHDIGKLAVPSEILTKPTRLSKAEFELVKDHSAGGHQILKDIPFLWPVARIVHEHHERLDGSGYPLGLKGEEILPESRILAVADMVEAMASHRPYRPALGVEVALKQIESEAGKKLDQTAVTACLQLFREMKYELPTS